MKKLSKTEQFNNNLAIAKSERKIPELGIPARLAIREAKIEGCLNKVDASFFEIGKELAEIQIEKDFAERTFDLYIKNRWGHNRDWGYKMIEGYKVKAGLSENVSPGIQTSVENKEVSESVTTEKQARALKKAPPEKRKQILDEVSKNGKATAKKIEEKIKEADFRVVVKDLNDDEVPENIASEFQRSRTETKEMRSKLQEVKRWLENEEQFKVEIARADALESVKDLISMIAVGAGEYICPICKGEKCKVCRKRGFVSKVFYSQSISDDKK